MFWTFLTIIVGAALSVIALGAPRVGERRSFQLCGALLFLFLAGYAAREAVPGEDPQAAIAGIFIFIFTVFWAAPFFACIVAYNITRVAREWSGLRDIVVRPFYSAAEAADARKDYIRAERLYRKALEKDPEEPEPRRRLATIYEKTSQYERAVEEFEAYADAAPELEDKFMALFQASDILADRLGKRQAAIQLLENLLRKYPKAKPSEYALRRLVALKRSAAKNEAVSYQQSASSYDF